MINYSKKGLCSVVIAAAMSVGAAAWADKSSSSSSSSSASSDSKEGGISYSADSQVSRSVPELDGGYALAALGLVAGLVLVMRERRKK